jgi:pyrroline-5-carboxylate reductase
MGGALLDAVLKSVDANKISMFDTDADKLTLKQSETGAVPVDIKTLFLETEYIFLGVKPNIILGVLEQNKQYINKNSVLISMAAGVALDKLVQFSGTSKVIRIMPNTPVAVGCGTVLYCCANNVNEDETDTFVRLLANAGLVDKIDEKLIDAAAALSGCGPAYSYMFIDALADGAVKCGLPRDKALMYAKQTVLGSAQMTIVSDKHPEKLKDEVCSPGGTTIEGVIALEKGSFRHTVASSVIAAYEKTSKLIK